MRGKNKNKFVAFFKKSGVLFLPAISSIFIFIVILSFSGLFWHRQYRLEVSQKEIVEQEKLEIITNIVGKLSAVVTSDLRILGSNRILHDYLETQKKEYRDYYAEELVNFSRDRKQYDQIRYIDEVGQEVIRVNYKGGLSYLTSDDDLQDKSSRYYFKESVVLGPDQLFISPIDLNVEGGKIEEPRKPAVRLAIPVFHNGQRRGIVIINFLAKTLLDEVDNSLKEKGERVYLVNEDSYWLKGPSFNDEWGFMYPDKTDKTFEQSYSEVWAHVFKKDSYQVINDEGLFTSHTIDPFEKTVGKNYSWKLISFSPTKGIAGESMLLANVLIIVNVVISLILFSTVTAITINIKRRLETEGKVVELNNTLKIITKVLRHDLANAFTHINFSFELYKENPKNKGILDEIVKSAKNGIEIINQMRELEGMAIGSQKLRKIKVTEALGEIIENYKIKFNISGSAIVFADDGIKSVFNNIISNAIRHGKTEKMDIKIEERSVLGDRSKKVVIKFIDYGIGVEDKIKNKVFDEGFKYGETGNTGLGLYIVEQIIKRYGGKIWVEDNSPKGAVFVIELDSK